MDDIQMNEANGIGIRDRLSDADCNSKKGFPLDMD
jgi:hypothetical protein